jgi:hypothetical protein
MIKNLKFYNELLKYKKFTHGKENNGLFIIYHIPEISFDLIG